MSNALENSMKKKSLVIALIAVGLIAATGYGLYAFGVHRGAVMSGTASNMGAATTAVGVASTAGSMDPSTGKKVLYWHDPMVPTQKFDKPGKSPFMDMMLVPVYADAGTDENHVSVSSRVQQNLGLRTVDVVRGSLTPRVEAVGNIAFDEREQAVVQARATGYIERLRVRATLDHVAKGQPLADLYVPDWVAAQEEFLTVSRMQGKDLAGLVDGARQRMRQVGMSDAQIALFEASGKVQPRVTLVAPVGGVVVELMAREGMTVMPGATLFRINSLSTVWANADVPESQAALLRPGAAVEGRSAALPNAIFKGTVQAILPAVDAATRTLKARVELANPGAQLVPGMFVTVALSTRAQEGLTVPTEAVIQTGQRSVVMLAEANGTYRPVDVDIGIESNGQTEIKRGLALGQKVIVSGQFLVDSEASLKGIGTRSMDAVAKAPTEQPAAIQEHHGEGKVESVTADSVTLSHGPIPTMQWGAMTMDFKAPATGMLTSIKVGSTVKFAFTMNKDGLPVLTHIEPKPAMGAMEKKQ
jgi:Cu(I)/Ag(I) efflux system membrane fusion protein